MKKDNCFKCKNKRPISGDCHISCANPDPDMKGNKIGINGGWFSYPHNFDPTWKAKECVNFESTE